MNESKSIESGSGKDNPGKDGEKGVIFRDLTGRSIIVFFLASSMNGVFNFFDDPRIQLFPFFLSVSVGIWYLAFHIAFHKDVPWLFMVASAFCCFFWVLTTGVVDLKLQRTHGRPHFRIVLSTDDTWDSEVALTNSFLTNIDSMAPSTNGSGLWGQFSITRDRVKGEIIIPIKSLDNLPKLNFTLQNDSRTTYETSDSWEFSFSFSTNLDFSADADWMTVRKTPMSDMRGFGLTLNQRQALSGNGIPLTPFQLKPCFAVSNNVGGLCMAHIVPKDRKDEFIIFGLYFPITTNINKIHIGPVTSNIFTIPQGD